jgi:hypothetical protein
MSRPAVDFLVHTRFLVSDVGDDLEGGPDFDSFAVEADESPKLAVFSMAWPVDPPNRCRLAEEPHDLSEQSAEDTDGDEKKDEPRGPASTDSEEDTDGEPPPKRSRLCSEPELHQQSLYTVDQSLFSDDSPADGGCEFHHVCNAWIKDTDDCCVKLFFCGHIVCPFFITNSNVNKKKVSINHHQRKCPGCVRSQSSTNSYRADDEPL